MTEDEFETMTGDEFDPYRNAAQQIVTAVLHDDRESAQAIAREVDVPLVLALVLGDLAASIHAYWAHSVGLDTDERDETWRLFLLDTEEWRVR